jgi:SAM-dependent methyltransferase
MNVQSYFSTKLVNLGAFDAGFSGIWSPENEALSQPLGLTNQFTDEAAEYVAKYANTDYFRTLVVRGLKLSKADLGRASRILDIGAGAGHNSVLPCLELFENPEIVATDLSPNLLALLRIELIRRGLTEQVGIVRVDAMLDLFKPQAFDLVIGAAILHHLMDPSRALAAAYQALRPGGFTMFFEPFEFGHSVLMLVFERILSEARLRGNDLDPAVSHFMYLFTQDLRRRLGRDKSDPIFKQTDDKWLFSNDYLREIGESVGFQQIRVESIHNPVNQISSRATALLSLGVGANVILPEWAQTIIAEADSAFPETRNSIIFEGIITMRKPSADDARQHAQA